MTDCPYQMKGNTPLICRALTVAVWITATGFGVETLMPTERSDPPERRVAIIPIYESEKEPTHLTRHSPEPAPLLVDQYPIQEPHPARLQARGIQPSPSSQDKTIAKQAYPARASYLSNEELTARAMEVEYEAQRHLDMLSEMYGLSAEQEDLVFPLLAMASESYNPQMKIAGAALTEEALAISPVDDSSKSLETDNQPEKNGRASLEDLESQIAPFLDEEQLDALDEEQMDRYFWWAEILEQISTDIDAEPDEPSSEPEHTEEEPDPEEEGPSDPHPGGNLFDLF